MAFHVVPIWLLASQQIVDQGWAVRTRVLKSKPFNEPKKEEIQDFWGQTEVQLRSNRDVSFNFFNIFDI